MHNGFSGTSADDLPPKSPSHAGQERMHVTTTVMAPAIVIRGLPGVGKTTLANEIVRQLRRGSCSIVYPAFHINADVVRARLNSDLGFSPAARVENARRIGAVAAMARINVCAPVIDFVMPTGETLDAFTDGFGGKEFSVFTLNGPADFETRFADTGKLFETDPVTRSTRHGPADHRQFYSLQPFGRGDVQLIAETIIQQVFK